MAQQKAVEPVVDEVDDLIDELQPGAKLLKGQYTITRYINSGGFGITYLAKDSLDRDVVIKECFPSSVCRRSKVMVAARSRAHTAELRSVVQLFVREARNLAKIVHPNIVAVHQVFEDNGTAYMAIDFIDGLDLQQIIDGEGAPLSQEHIVEITVKLLKAVGFIHDHDMLHRDISPDNVLIDKKGEPILIDFGAAREKASQSNRAMSALRVVKDGYSPQEFYIAGSEQGPWSDLYALGATLYHVISGEAPVNGQARLAALAEDRADPYLPLTGRFAGYPAGFLEAIDSAMSTLPKQRLQSAKEWLAMFASAPVTLAEPAPGTDDAVKALVTDFRRTEEKVAAPAPVVRPSRVTTTAASAAPTGDAPKGKSPMPIIAGVVALAVAAGGYMFLGGSPEAPQAASESAPASATASAESGTKVESGTTAATTAPAVETATAAPAEPEPAPTTAPETKTETAVVAEPAPAAVDPEPAAEPEVAAATVEPAAEPAVEAAADPAPAETEVAAATPEPAAATGTPAASQVDFAAWDAELPFAADDRLINGKSAAMVVRLSPNFDPQTAGSWLRQGVVIHSINGRPTPTASALTTGILNAMQVDPDGRARVVAEYTGSDGDRKTGLLTVEAVRLVNLSNGVRVRTETVDGTWQSVVTGVAKPAMTSLRQGDVLFRDKATGIPLDGPTSLESILGELVKSNATQSEFSIVRDKKVDVATMQLVLSGNP
ncbi:serine/threonine-protein kinase [Rhodobacter sp. SY28-1]|uniref:serine/threonine-protein kinase n=1 Tax=Rhodobacter sp. SY28-1 TaxID=2562317 RepID=UPI001484F800|nr:serine/threonine-protein kinase [Rhodobacter sp. SY28-1]